MGKLLDLFRTEMWPHLKLLLHMICEVMRWWENRLKCTILLLKIFPCTMLQLFKSSLHCLWTCDKDLKFLMLGNMALSRRCVEVKRSCREGEEHVTSKVISISLLLINWDVQMDTVIRHYYDMNGLLSRQGINKYTKKALT